MDLGAVAPRPYRRPLGTLKPIQETTLMMQFLASKAMTIGGLLGLAALGGGTLAAATPAPPTPADDEHAVAALDTRYQAAVKANDAATMGEILDDRFVLVLGNGNTATKADLLAEARSGRFHWQHQEEEAGTQTVRVFGDTAVVTAKLWVAGSDGERTFDRKLWFSDTYVRTPAGWRYAFGQASLALPASP